MSEIRVFDRVFVPTIVFDNKTNSWDKSVQGENWKSSSCYGSVLKISKDLATVMQEMTAHNYKFYSILKFYKLYFGD